MSSPTFAQAQERLAARRAAREAEASARQAAEQSESQLRARIAASRSPLLRRAGSSVLSAWDALSSREGTRPAFRVGQVDAELLDDELVDLLRNQVGDALKYLGGIGENLKDEWAAETLLVLRAILFKLTVWDHDATYGAALQNLRYTDARQDRTGSGGVLRPPTRWQKSLYGLLTVGGKYAWTKWEDWLLDQDNGYDAPRPRVRRLSRLSELVTTAHAAAALASFLVFLVRGRYRTLLDRALRMRLAPATSQVSREVSFEYLNRQLVWHAFTEFLLFVLPLVGINRWRRWIARTWRRTKDLVQNAGGHGDDDSSQQKEKKGEYAFLPERTCAICYQDQNEATTETDILAAVAASSGGVVGSAQTDITNPYEAVPCGCVYCFVCLATRLEREEGEGWTCLRCGGLVRECKPWGGDVLEPASARKSGGTKRASASSAASTRPTKTVGFADGVKGEGEEDDTSEDFVSAVSEEAELLEDEGDETATITDAPPGKAEEEEEKEAEPGSGSSTDTDSEAYEEEEGLGDDMDGS